LTGTQGLRTGMGVFGTGALRVVLASATALLVLIALPSSSALAATENVVSPLPASDYTARHVCAPPAPGYAGCLALELVAKTAAARAHTHPLGITKSRPIVAVKASEGAFGLRPQDLHSIYALPTTVASTQTIALVDAYNDLSAAADLKVYDKEFGLPECTVANGCFEQVNQNGETGKPPFPASSTARTVEEAACEIGNKTACKEVEEATGWATEISLDIEASHATCESCKIVLVEADSDSFGNLEEAEQAAADKLGATEISNSWGGPEPDETTAEDNASSFNHPGTVIAAAAGDDGYLDWASEDSSERGYVDYPASSPHVVAVGGTRLLGPLGPGGAWAGEQVWNGDGAGGGGCSTELTAPAWQQSTSDWSSVGCGKHRAVADVSADADPYTGLAVYDSGSECKYEEDGTTRTTHWCTIGGTSLASPLIAATFALAGGAHGVSYPAQSLYENELEDPATLHDVVSGSNGECTEPFSEEGLSGCTTLQEANSCSQQAICLAREGYDGPTGVGTPNGILAFAPVSAEVKRANEEKQRSAEAKLREEQSLEEKRKEAEARKQAEAAAEARKQAEASEGQDAGSGAGTTSGSSDTGAASGDPSAGGAPATSRTVETGAASKATPSPASKTAKIIRLTALALTPTALLSLTDSRPRASSIAFAFTLSAAARVHATFAELVRAHGHDRWVSLPDALTFSAARGRNRRHLASPDGLAPGRYRLTLAPQGGAARTLTFQVG
jgi:hypothetical protein